MRKIYFWIACAVLVHQVSFADDPKLGRLPDGRAYRTDSQGTQLVDYIAELELTVDSLKRQVQGLEDEVTEKASIISRCDNPELASLAVKEKDLIGATTAQNSSECTTKLISMQQQIDSLKSRAIQSDASASADFASMNSQIETLRAELKNKDKAIKGAASQQEELGNVNILLEETNRKLDQERAENSRYESELATLKARLKDKTQEVETLRTSVSSRGDSFAIDAGEARGALRSPTLSDARIRALDIMRGKLVTEINNLNGLVVSREKMYNEYIKDPKRVMFKLSDLISSRRFELAKIKKGIGEADSVYQLSLYQRDLAEIKGKVQDDINLMKRMERM